MRHWLKISILEKLTNLIILDQLIYKLLRIFKEQKTGISRCTFIKMIYGYFISQILTNKCKHYRQTEVATEARMHDTYYILWSDALIHDSLANFRVAIPVCYKR